MLSKCPGGLSPYLNLGSTIFEHIPGVIHDVIHDVFAYSVCFGG